MNPMLRSFCVFSAAAIAVAFTASNAMADTVSSYGDTVIVGGNYQFTSDPNALGYAGLEDQITTTLTPSLLTQLSVNYQMTQGTFGGGAPRFTIFDGSFNSAWIYFGTPLGGGSFSDPNFGNSSFASTGNYADLSSPDVRVYSNGFGGDNSSNTGVTWSQFVATLGVGNTQISYITLDLDGGFTPSTTQVMLVNDFNVNGTQYNPVSATPLPSAAWSGFALLTCIGMFAGIKRFRTCTI